MYDELYPIGEISRMFEMPIPTLRYYDEIGLLKPEFKDENSGYRYYGLSQFKDITLIRYLRTSGVPLREIREIMSKLSPENYVDLMISQQKRIVKELENLESILSRFNHRVDEIKAGICIENDAQIVIKELPPRKIIYHEARIASRTDLEKAIRKFEMKLGHVIDNVGLTISFDDLTNGNWNINNSIFVYSFGLESETRNGLDFKELKAGHYVCMYCKAKQKESSNHYRMILDYIKQNGYELEHTDSIRKALIDTSISKSEDKYLAEIQIPIRL